jgi:hypothetical protein
MVEADLPPALRSPWAIFVLRNRAQDISGFDVERSWANDLINLGLSSEAVVALQKRGTHGTGRDREGLEQERPYDERQNKRLDDDADGFAKAA